MSEGSIKVLSLNCWGLKYVSKNRQARLEAIAHALSQVHHDIIALQEVWVFSDYERVRDNVSKRLPYSKFFYSGALGAGLAIFTRFPIIEASIKPYSLNGAPIDVAAGDWFVGKAAASVVILHPILNQVQVFNTHLFAKGGEDGPEHNRAHRLVNAYEFAKLAREAAEKGRYVVALGDFNSIPASLPMSVILEYAGLADAWAVTHPQVTNAVSISTAIDAVNSLGITSDSPLNSWSADKSYAFGTWGKRLDYVLYRQPKRLSMSPMDTFPILQAIQADVVLTGNVPGHTFSYSDHFGVEATLEIQTSESGAPLQSKKTELSSASVGKTIQALTECYRFSRLRGRRELSIFGLCLLLLAALTISSAWLPHSWINPIFLLFTIFVSWLATTMLYEGFLYGNWECNALMNVIEELEIYKKGLEIQSRAQR